MAHNDKRCQIFNAAFIALGDAEVTTGWGGTPETIQVTGEWTKLPVKDAEYSEESKGDGIYSQKFEARMADTSAAQLERWRSLLAVKGLLRLDYTNGESKVVGDEEWPVLLTLLMEGSPAKLQLSLKRDCSSCARPLSSF